MKFSRNITNISGLQLFQLIRYSAVILIGILLSKSGISTDTIGLYEKFLLLTGFFTIFWSQGLLKAMLPLIEEKNETEKGILFVNTFVLLFVIAAIANILLLVSSNLIESLLLHGKKIPYIELTILYILFNAPSILTEYIYLTQNKARKIVAYGSIVFTIQLLLVGLPPFFNLSIKYSIIGLVATSLIKFLWTFNLLSHKSFWKFNPTIWKHLLLYSFPLIISTLLTTSAKYIDGFIITSKFSQSEYAVFSYGAKELPLVLLLANSLSLSMISKFASNNIQKHLITLKKQASNLGLFLFPLSAFLIMLSHFLFPLLFNQSFEDSATIFNIYLLLIICRLMFPQTILLGKQLNKQLMLASFFELLINVSLSIWFATLFGIVGVAYATIVANIFEKVYLSVIVKTKLNISISSYFPWKQNLSMSIILIVIFLIIENIVY